MSNYKNALARFFIFASCALAVTNNAFGQFRSEEKFSDQTVSPAQSAQQAANPAQPSQPALPIPGQPAPSNGAAGAPTVPAQPAPRGPVVSKVSVSPATVTVTAGKTVKFSADVVADRGATSYVLWSAKLGTIDQGGTYTAPTKVLSETKTEISACSTQPGFMSMCGKSEVTITPGFKFNGWYVLAIALVVIALALLLRRRRRHENESDPDGDQVHDHHISGSHGIRVALTIQPTTATVRSRNTQQFEAVVLGAAHDESVTWSVDHGNITRNGLFTAPDSTVAMVATVTATSNEDRTSVAQATVRITPFDPTPTTRTSHVVPMIGFLIIGVVVSHAATVTGCNPCAGAIGQTFTTILSGEGLGNVASVDFAGSGVSGAITSHSGNQLVISGQVAPNASATNRQMRLNKTDGTFFYVPNVRFGVDTLDNLRVAQLGAQMAHSTMPVANSPVANSTTPAPRPTYLPGRDTTARENATTAIYGVRSLAERIDRLERQYANPAPAAPTQSPVANQTPAPTAPTPAARTPQAAPQQSATPAPSVPASANNNQLAQIQQQLGQMQSTLQANSQRVDGLVGQVGNLQQAVAAVDQNNRKLVGGIETMAGYTVKSLKHKSDRCAMVADMEAAGFRVSNPEAAGCK